MLRYSTIFFITLLSFCDTALSQLDTTITIWTDTTGVSYRDTLIVDTAGYHLYGPFNSAKPTTSSFLFLTPAYPNKNTPYWENSIYNWQGDYWPYQSSPPYFMDKNLYDTSLVKSLWKANYGKVPDNYLSSSYWVGVPKINKLRAERSGGSAVVRNYAYSIFPLFKFPLYRNGDTVGIRLPDWMTDTTGINDTSTVADVVQIDANSIKVRRKEDIHSRGLLVKKTRLDSFVVQFAQNYYTYNTDTNYYNTYNTYNIDTNFFYTNIDTNIYIYNIDTNIYITNNNYYSNPDTFVTAITAYPVGTDSMRIELTRSNGATTLYTVFRSSSSGMIKHGINDTTYHNDYPLQLNKGGTNYTNYTPSLSGYPTFFAGSSYGARPDAISPSTTFSKDMYVNPGINFSWGGWRQWGDMGQAYLRFMYDSIGTGITFGQGSYSFIMTNMYGVVNNGKIGGYFLSLDSAVALTNGIGNVLQYRNDRTLRGINTGKIWDDAINYGQLYDSLIWRHGYTGTVSSISSFTVCEDTITMTVNDVTYFDGLIRKVTTYQRKLPTCTRIPTITPIDTADVEPETPTWNPVCKGSRLFSVTPSGKMTISKEYLLGDVESSGLRVFNTIKAVVKNLTEDDYLGLTNSDSLYMVVSGSSTISGSWYTLPSKFKLAPGDSQIVTIVHSNNINDYGYWTDLGGGPTIFGTLYLTFSSLGSLDYNNNFPKPILCSEYGKKYASFQLEGVTSVTYSNSPPVRHEIILSHQVDCSDNNTINGKAFTAGTGGTIFIEEDVKITDSIFTIMTPRIESDLSIRIQRNPSTLPEIITATSSGTIQDLRTGRYWNTYEFRLTDWYKDFSENKVVNIRTFFHARVDTFISLGLPEYAFNTITNHTTKYQEKTIPMFLVHNLPRSYSGLQPSTQEKLAHTLNAIWKYYDVCQGATPPTVPDWSMGDNPDTTSTGKRDTLWIADRFAKHSIVDTGSHSNLNMTPTSSMNYPLWIYNGSGFQPTSYTANSLISASSDTIIALMDSTTFATKPYVASYTDGLFLKKVDTTNKWQPKGTYLVPSDSNNIRIGSNALYQPKGSYQPLGTYLVPADSNNIRTGSNALYQPIGSIPIHTHTVDDVREDPDNNGKFAWFAGGKLAVSEYTPASFVTESIYDAPLWKNAGHIGINFGNGLAVSTNSLVVNKGYGLAFGTLGELYALKVDSSVLSSKYAQITHYHSNYLSLGDSIYGYWKPWKIQDAINNIGFVAHIHRGSQSDVIDVHNGLAWATVGEEGYTYRSLGAVFGSTAGTISEGNHKHSAYDITSGKLPIVYGGTGASAFTNDQLIEYAYSESQEAYILKSSGYTKNSFALVGAHHTLTEPLIWTGTGGTTLAIRRANANTSGYLHTDEWNNFNAAYSWGNHASAGYASTSWVTSNFSSIGHGHDSYWWDGLHPTTLLGYGITDAASISWVTSNFSGINHGHDGVYSFDGHTHSQYLTSESDPTVPSHVKGITTTDISNWNSAITSAWFTSWQENVLQPTYATYTYLSNNYLSKSGGTVTGTTTFNDGVTIANSGLSVGTAITAGTGVMANTYVIAGSGFVHGTNQGASATVTKTFVTGVTINPTYNTIQYINWSMGQSSMTVLTNATLTVNTASISLTFSGGIYTGGSGWSGNYKEGEINLTMDEYNKLKDNSWQIDPEYLEFVEWKKWKKEQLNKIKLVEGR